MDNTNLNEGQTEQRRQIDEQQQQMRADGNGEEVEQAGPHVFLPQVNEAEQLLRDINEKMTNLQRQMDRTEKKLDLVIAELELIRPETRSVGTQVFVQLDADPPMTSDEVRLLARHEGAHCTVMFFSRYFWPVEMYITVDRQGLTVPFERFDERTKQACLAEIECYLAGPIGETIFYDGHSVECDNDIMRAKNIMRQMIYDFGFYPEETGLTNFTPADSLSEQTKQRLDLLKKRELQACEERVRTLLTRNMDVVDQLAERLIKNNCFMTYKQIYDFFNEYYDLDNYYI